ncbi:hypothetical protein GCM10011511_16420 [Puia dinghuensis]|uniref:Uncharacterized protein n=1 Tax=Puia dinghuensis TaxID=1792502 RepID=A0A8J2XSV6_9BACT|nr:hypothetical protein GCM10011511_16420 [Puia dinghuensis]
MYMSSAMPGIDRAIYSKRIGLEGGMLLTVDESALLVDEWNKQANIAGEEGLGDMVAAPRRGAVVLEPLII